MTPASKDSPAHALPGACRLSRIAPLLMAVAFASCSDDTVVPEPDLAPTIVLTAPAASVAVAPGGTLEINWATSDDHPGVTVDLSYTADGGKSGTIATAQTSNAYSWTTPKENLFGVVIKATARDASGQTADAVSSKILAVVAHSSRGYVTSSVCKNCHAKNYEEVFQSGHPYKINKVVGGKAPTYPFTTVPSPPVGYTWNDITYVIGGYGWKARFMDKDGYIMTTGVLKKNVQYNVPRSDLGMSEGWTGYEGGATAPKPYTCGTCHTTGWLTTAENGGKNQDGLKGIAGTWEEPGITCEQCHGAGAAHVASKSKADITVDQKKELCGSCHFRDTNHGILASGGYIEHHEQYDELISAGHGSLACTTCHDQHLGTRWGHAKQGGIKVSCQSCHTKELNTNGHAFPLDCETCHMPYAGKSAQTKNAFSGDVKTHIFKINPEPVGKNQMFFVENGKTFAKGAVTLDFVCYQCHKDPITGVGGAYSAKSLAELSARAKGIHN